jgi:hypothetical protein
MFPLCEVGPDDHAFTPRCLKTTTAAKGFSKRHRHLHAWTDCQNRRETQTAQIVLRGYGGG